METKQVGIIIDMIAAILGVIGAVLILTGSADMIMVGWVLIIVGVIIGIIGAALIKLWLPAPNMFLKIKHFFLFNFLILTC